LSRHVQELLAFCGFNFLRLKSFYLQGGARLVDELSEALEDKFVLVPPGKPLIWMTHFNTQKPLNIYTAIIFVARGFNLPRTENQITSA